MVAIVLLGIAGLVIQIYFCVTFARIAESKGYEGLTYGLICFFLGIIGYCLVAALPDLTLQEQLNIITNKLSRMESNTVAPEAPTPAPATSRPIASAKPVTEAEITPSVIDDNNIVCPKCNTVQPANRKVCWSCGQRFVATENAE